MRFLEFRQDKSKNILNEAAKVGREYQHLEDLVFIEGSKGAQKAADTLEKLGSDSSDVAIKWDGYPTLYWGRDDDGQFILVGKNGWLKGAKAGSAKELKKFITSTGKGEDWRDRFANEMSEIFKIVEPATPEDFRGYVYGDLLFHPGKPFERSDDSVQFTPNKVTYTISNESELGKRIATSKVGIVVHTKFDEFGSKSGQPISDVKELNNKDVVVLGQTYVAHQPKIDTSEVQDIRDMAGANATDIDQFLAGQKGLSNVPGIIYTYMNQMSKAQKLGDIENGFFNWLKTSKVSQGQQEKLAQMNEDMPKALPAIFGLVKRVMAAKDHIIDQLDNADADVKQSTAGEKGGEGYVDLGTKTKLVPRGRWQPN